MEVEDQALSGRVTFAGVDAALLNEIRVIPETGKHLKIPGNHSYDQVDGFWWKGDQTRWFKIPDHGEAWVGRAPSEFDGEASLGNVRVFYRSNRLLGFANAMLGGVREPGWVEDRGATRSPVEYPW